MEAEEEEKEKKCNKEPDEQINVINNITCDNIKCTNSNTTSNTNTRPSYRLCRSVAVTSYTPPPIATNTTTILTNKLDPITCSSSLLSDNLVAGGILTEVRDAKCKEEQEQRNQQQQNNLNEINFNTLRLCSETIVRSQSSEDELDKLDGYEGCEDADAAAIVVTTEESCTVTTTDSNPSDSTEDELEKFLYTTLIKNTKDRHLMYRIEADLNQMLRDSTQTHLTFPQMSSYQRMLVHRIATWFKLEHNLDSTLQSAVCVSKKFSEDGNNCLSKIPKINLRQLEKKWETLILNSTTASCSPSAVSGLDLIAVAAVSSSASANMGGQSQQKSKTSGNIRKKDYPTWQVGSERQFYVPGGGQQLQGHRQSSQAPLWMIPPKTQSSSSSRLLKVESLEVPSSSSTGSNKPMVAKSYSFGGYSKNIGHAGQGYNPVGGASAISGGGRFGQSVGGENISHQSSIQSNLSPASSGYKSTSFDTYYSLSPPPPAPVAAMGQQVGTAVGGLQIDPSNQQSQQASSQLQPSTHSSQQQYYMESQLANPSQQQLYYWAVTDMNQIPYGAMLLDVNTHQLIRNEDGTPYYYDPINPPPQSTNGTSMQSILLSSQLPQQQRSNPSLLYNQPQLQQCTPSQLQQQYYYNPLLQYNDPTTAVTGIIPQSPHSATGIQQNYVLQQQQQLPYYYYYPPNNNLLQQQYSNMIQPSSLYLQQIQQQQSQFSSMILPQQPQPVQQFIRLPPPATVDLQQQLQNTNPMQVQQHGGGFLPYYLQQLQMQPIRQSLAVNATTINSNKQIVTTTTATIAK